MTEQTQQPDPLANEILTFNLTVEQTNHALQIFGNAPYVASAPLIALFKEQGEPQFKALLEKVNNESQTTTKTSGNPS